MTFRIGNISAIIEPSGTVVLRTPTNVLAIDRADLNDAIMALCEASRLQDPEGRKLNADNRRADRATSVTTTHHPNERRRSRGSGPHPVARTAP
jgi:hypothetical protein